jgi:hypothetical protein
MPDFSVDDISIEPYEYVSACGSGDIQELIDELVDAGYLPKSVLKYNKKGKVDDGLGRLQSEFSDKLNKLVNAYYSMSKEDEETLETIFKKYN